MTSKETYAYLVSIYKDTIEELQRVKREKETGWRLRAKKQKDYADHLKLRMKPLLEELSQEDMEEVKHGVELYPQPVERKPIKKEGKVVKVRVVYEEGSHKDVECGAIEAVGSPMPSTPKTMSK